MGIVQIFIPTFNRRKLLESAIGSVLNQTYPSVEVMVLDNASTDDTQVFLADLVRRDSRVRFHRNPENIGMIGNFNLIRQFVSRPFFCVLTDDDVYEPHFLATAMGLFQTYPSIALAATTAPIRRGDVVVRDIIETWADGFHAKGSQVEACSHSRHPLFTHCIFKGYLAEEFIFHEEIGNSSDGFLLTCIATKYDVAISKAVTGYWSVNGENATEKQVWEPEAYIKALIACGRLYAEFCKNNGLANTLAWYYQWKLKIGLLQVARDKVSFDKLIKRPDIKECCNPVEYQMIRLLSSIRFLEMALWVKGALRKAGLLK